MDEIHEEKVFDEMPERGNLSKTKENLDSKPRTVVEPSIEELYDNVCEMQSSDRSPSRNSYGSDGEESMIDSELRHLVGSEMREVEIIEEDEAISNRNEEESSSKSPSRNSKKESRSRSQLGSETSSKSSPTTKTRQTNHLLPNKNDKKSRKPIIVSDKDSSIGPFLLKQARDLIGTNPRKALDLALRATSSFEKSVNGKPSLDIVMCLHVTAAIYSGLGQYNEAIPILENSIEILVIDKGHDHALAKFSGLMQLGDTYAMLGRLQNSLKCYESGLQLQKRVLGETDPRIGETCRYLSEAHVQALKFNEAERFCRMALEIHSGFPAEEAADRRLLALICSTKGDHEAALEHLVAASMTMAAAGGQETEISFVDLSIGDAYLSLSRYDEAVSAYHKSLDSLKSSKGETHPSVASVFGRLAGLCNKTGKFNESKSYCENALRIYENPVSGFPQEEIACGFTNISAIYESMEELDLAVELLHKALKIYNGVPGQKTTIAGIEAEMGVLYYMLGKYSESYDSFESAILKLRESSEKRSVFYGIALNQMGLTCVQRFAINEAIECFEEARSVLEDECGPFHPDTLSVYSNLAGTYDAVGRLDDAIEILEHVVEIREEKLGTAGLDVDDEKKRLAELLKEAGKVRSKKARSLMNLLDSNYREKTNNDAIEV